MLRNIRCVTYVSCQEKNEFFETCLIFQKIFCTFLLGLDWQIQTIIAVGFANPTEAVLENLLNVAENT